MTDFLDLAKDHVSKGFFVFPAQPENKRPIYGLMAWEQQATNDVSQIMSWWSSHPDSLPAIAPGVTGHAVIDVDRHEGSEDGFVSLAKENIIMPEEAASGLSLSGNGRHFWFQADVGSLNAVLKGVDRKARGGYVVAPYELPYALDIRTLLPEALSGNRLYSTAVRQFMTPQQLDEWLSTIGSGPISEPMWQVIETFQARGHQHMNSSIARIVSIAARGESGASKALDKMLDMWLDAPHNSGNPEEDFQSSTRSAIEKFGEPVYGDDEVLEEFYALARGERPFDFDRAALRESFLVFCDSHVPEWRQDDELVAFINKCLALVPQIANAADVETWGKKTKVAVMKKIGKSWETS